MVFLKLTLPFISFSAALAASFVVYSMNAYPLDLLEILSIIILTVEKSSPSTWALSHSVTEEFIE